MTNLKSAGTVRRAIGLAVAAVVGVAALALSGAGVFGHGGSGDDTDPARDQALPCEIVGGTTAQVPRSARKIQHVANICGLVGTDIEFQSRTSADSKRHHYAFLGTMGSGMRIFDITDPADPKPAGSYIDPGWQNDVQVEGHLAVLTFDGVVGEDSTGSTCLKERYPEAMGQGVDILQLNYNRNTAKFQPKLLTCIANAPGGAHNSTLNPRRQYLAISNPSSDWAVDIIDLRPIENNNSRTSAPPDGRHIFRLIDESRKDSVGRCPEDAQFACIVMRRPDGSSASELWRPHDLHFSNDGRTMFVAALNSTFIVDVAGLLDFGKVKTLSIIPNVVGGGDPDGPEDIELSHQADISADGKILVISDEKGGGVSNTECNTSNDDLIGALHFWAVEPIPGVARTQNASLTNPRKLGFYINPSPPIGPDPLQAALDLLPRLERGCTVHVFRLGGNGSSSPGTAEGSLGGVSSLGIRRLVTAWYGAGTWYIDFSGPPRNNDGVAEASQTTWGNTLGWNVMPGAETWSAKEYRGHIYTGDMARGFDVFSFGGP